MQLILELLKKIFVALQGVYTKQESDTALTTKADATALTEEAQAREEADSALNAKIDSNTANDNALANVVKWQSYAAAIQSMVDETTAAQIAEEFERAANEYLADPAATKTWSTTNDDSGNFATSNPYYYESPTRPIVDFIVKNAIGKTAHGVGCFSADIDVPVFIPRAENISGVFGVIKTNPIIIAPNAAAVSTAFANSSKYNRPLSFPKAKNCSYMLTGASSFDSYIYLPLGKDCSFLLRNAIRYNKYVKLTSCRLATGAFYNTAMSAENISKTLDSLPAWADGAAHVITFTGSPGAAELTQESPSVAAAVARGWTVEL